MSDLSIARYFPWRRMRVISQSVSDESKSALVKLAPDRRFRPLCHKCGQPGGFHSWTRKFVRDRNFGDYTMLLHIEYRKLRCRQCRRVHVERLDFVDTSQRVTMRLGTYAAELCRRGLAVETVADHLDLDPKTVKQFDKQALTERFGQTEYEGLERIAIDEIAVKKGHHYMTVVLDYDIGRVVWMGKGRQIATLGNGGPPQVDFLHRQSIEDVHLVAIVIPPVDQITQPGRGNAKRDLGRDNEIDAFRHHDPAARDGGVIQRRLVGGYGDRVRRAHARLPKHRGRQKRPAGQRQSRHGHQNECQPANPPQGHKTAFFRFQKRNALSHLSSLPTRDAWRNVDGRPLGSVGGVQTYLQTQVTTNARAKNGVFRVFLKLWVCGNSGRRHTLISKRITAASRSVCPPRQSTVPPLPWVAALG